MDIADYRRALSCFPTGVTIVTVFDAAGAPWGLTANSFASVSLEPAVISVCIARSGRAYPIIGAADRFAINILSAGQEALARHFASRIENRFTGTDWEANDGGAPLLPGAAARLDCTVHARVDAGDHEILLGRVADYDHNPSSPLVFCRGNFFAAPQPETVS